MRNEKKQNIDKTSEYDWDFKVEYLTTILSMVKYYWLLKYYQNI